MRKVCPIGRYHHGPATLEDPDPRAVDVAEYVRGLVRAELPGVEVEHIGSTAVPALPGKGIIDLLLTYPDGALGVARGLLDTLGFQRQDFGDPFPEERPMRVGTVDLDGRTYQVHVHVISAASEEAIQLRAFRDLLRHDPGLAEAYAQRKRELIEAGVVGSPEYAVQKTGFIRGVLDAHRRGEAPPA
jgi:GrpB-like predicted nucleotidyltransferase (UPF0157 family)